MTTTRHYIGGIEYIGTTIDKIQTETGVAQNNGGTFTYHHNLTDHLGNVRYTFDIYNGAVRRLQEDNYYAFGKRQGILGGTNGYLFNGKEMQYELNSAGEDGQYDYGARYYDPVIGRWNVVDPLAELMGSWSPYNYCFNNPVNFVDPYGLAPNTPGSGNHWSDSFRSFNGNAAIMSQRTFDSFYNINNDEDRARVAQGAGTSIFQSGGGQSLTSFSVKGNKISYGFTYSTTEGDFGMGAGRGIANLDNVANNGGSFGNEFFEKANIGLGLFGIVQGQTQFLMEQTVAFDRGVKISQINNISKIRALGKVARVMNGVQHVGKIANFAGIGVVGLKVLYNQQVKPSDVLEGMVGGAAFIPVWGWAVGGGYLVADAITKGITEKSIGDHLNDSYGNEALVSWK